MHPGLTTLIGQLNEVAALTHAGLDSEQASNIVFHRLAPNAPVQSQYHKSSCCGAPVYFSGDNAYCTECYTSCGMIGGPHA